MTVAKLPKEPTELGKRILRALDEERRSQNSAATAAGFGRGYLSRLIYGTRGGTSINPEHMKELAKVLHVQFEWLVVGEGPMRREGRGSTPAEEAIIFARMQGCREDAIQNVWHRFKDEATQMTVFEWIDEIGREAIRLNRAGMPRPEVVAERHEAIRKNTKKLERNRKQIAEKERAADEALTPVARRLRA